MAASMSVTFTPTPIGATFSLLVSATQQVSNGIMFMPRGRYKLLTATALNVASPIDLLAAYTAKFGALVAGQKVFISAQVLHEASGITGPIYHTSVLV
jgi:hypothetical protein